MNKFQKLLGIQVQRIEQEMTAETDRATGYLRQQGDMHIRTLNSVGREEIGKIAGNTAEQGRLINAAGHEQARLIAAGSNELTVAKPLPDFTSLKWTPVVLVFFAIEWVTIMLFAQGSSEKNVSVFLRLAPEFVAGLRSGFDTAVHWIVVNVPDKDGALAVFLAVMLVCMAIAYGRYVAFLSVGAVAMVGSGAAFYAWFSFTGYFSGKGWWFDEEAWELCGYVLALIAPSAILPIMSKLFLADGQEVVAIPPPPSPPQSSPPKPTQKNNILN